ncbi:hypothetical protein HK096_009722, partial [Nowakowskiella sp. JEL0078]
GSVDESERDIEYEDSELVTIENVSVEITDSNDLEHQEYLQSYIQVVEQPTYHQEIVTQDQVEIVYDRRAQVLGDIVVVPESPPKPDEAEMPFGTLAAKLAVAKPIDLSEARSISPASLNILLARALPPLPETKDNFSSNQDVYDVTLKSKKSKKKNKDKERRSSIDVLKGWLPGLFNSADRPTSPILKPRSPTLATADIISISSDSDESTLSSDSQFLAKQPFSSSLKSRLRPLVPRGSPEPAEEIYTVLTSTPQQWEANTPSKSNSPSSNLSSSTNNSTKPIFKRPTLKNSLFKPFSSKNIPSVVPEMPPPETVERRTSMRSSNPKRKSFLASSVIGSEMEWDDFPELSSLVSINDVQKLGSDVGKGTKLSLLNDIMKDETIKSKDSTRGMIVSNGQVKKPPTRVLGKSLKSVVLPELSFSSLMDECDDLLLDPTENDKNNKKPFQTDRNGKYPRNEKSLESFIKGSNIGGMVGDINKNNLLPLNKTDVDKDLWEIGIDMDWFDATLKFASSEK